MDPVGGDVAANITASLRDDGELIVFGRMSVPTSNVGIRDLMFRGVKVGGCCRSNHDIVWSVTPAAGTAGSLRDRPSTPCCVNLVARAGAC